MILTGFADPDDSTPSIDDRRPSWSVPPPAMEGLDDPIAPASPPSAPARVRPVDPPAR